MRRVKKINIIKILAFFILCILFACEFEEPFIDPVADFKLFINDEATGEEQLVTEPYSLTANQNYILRVTGEGEQFVLWQGVPTVPGKTSGSLFDDRGINHNSAGEVIKNEKIIIDYSDIGTYELVFVASSYRYADDKYVEDILKKSIEVIQ